MEVDELARQIAKEFWDKYATTISLDKARELAMGRLKRPDPDLHTLASRLTETALRTASLVEGDSKAQKVLGALVHDAMMVQLKEKK